MNVLAIYSINQHIAELMAEANAERMVRTAKPKPSLRLFLASLFAFRGQTATAAAS